MPYRYIFLYVVVLMAISIVGCSHGMNDQEDDVKCHAIYASRGWDRPKGGYPDKGDVLDYGIEVEAQPIIVRRYKYIVMSMVSPPIDSPSLMADIWKATLRRVDMDDLHDSSRNGIYELYYDKYALHGDIIHKGCVIEIAFDANDRVVSICRGAESK